MWWRFTLFLFLAIFITRVIGLPGCLNAPNATATTTIYSQSDADALLPCPTVGTIIISPLFASSSLSLGGYNPKGSGAAAEKENIGPLKILGDFICQNVSALETLTSDAWEISGSLIFSDLVNLQHFTFNNLSEVSSSVSISNTPQLVWDPLTLGDLIVVGGDVLIKGNSSSVTFPSLHLVDGNVDIESSTPDIDCPVFLAAKNSGNIQGTCTCISSNDVEPLSTSTSSTTPTPRASNPISVSSGLSRGGKIGIAVSIVVILQVLCGFAYFVWRKRWTRELESRKIQNQDSDCGFPKEAELPQGGHHEIPEAPVVERPGELLTEEKPGELKANYGPGCDVHEME